MDPNCAAADMIEHLLAAERHRDDLREVVARKMFQPDPMCVSDLLDERGEECSLARVRAELRFLRPAGVPRPARRSVVRDRQRAFHSRQLSLGF